MHRNYSICNELYDYCCQRSNLSVTLTLWQSLASTTELCYFLCSLARVNSPRRGVDVVDSGEREWI